MCSYIEFVVALQAVSEPFVALPFAILAATCTESIEVELQLASVL